MRFIAEAASTEVDLRGDRFAPEALYQMAEDVKGKEILILERFDKNANVGFVDSAKVVGNKLIIEGELLVGLLSKPPEGFFVVPGYQIREMRPDGRGYTDSDVKLVCFGLSDDPTDSSLSALREMEFKKCVMD